MIAMRCQHLEPINLSWRRALQAAAALVLVGCAQATPTPTDPSGPAGSNAVTVQDNKQQLIGFLTRLKQAIDADVVGKPEQLRAVLGLEVLEWYQFETKPTKLAQRWRYNVPAMDTEPLLLSKPNFVYSINQYRPDAPPRHYIRVSYLASVACIGLDEVNAVFGPAPVRFTPTPAPLHGNAPPPNQPAWLAAAYHYLAARQLLITLDFLTAGSRPPVATCLAGVSVLAGFDSGLPPGYPPKVSDVANPR